jgi:hypothetical protein
VLIYCSKRLHIKSHLYCNMLSGWRIALRRQPVISGNALTVMDHTCRARKTKNLRGNMTQKRANANRNFEKGYGAKMTGTVSKQGKFNFFPDLDKILDLQIPDLTGFEVIHSIHIIHPNLMFLTNS